MRKHSIKFSFLAISTLIGCASDLRTDESIAPRDRAMAVRISELTQKQCTHFKYDPGTGRKLFGDNQFAELPSVKKLHYSTQGWVKAEILADGVWDSTYYLSGSDKIICGEKGWQAYADSNSVIFSELKSSKVNLPSGPAEIPIGDQVVKLKTNEIIRPIAIQWQNYSGPISGLVTINENGRRGTIKASLPTGEGDCAGIYETNNLKSGHWAISCANGLTATGTLELLGAGKGSTGIGTDGKGGKIAFTVGATTP